MDINKIVYYKPDPYGLDLVDKVKTISKSNEDIQIDMYMTYSSNGYDKCQQCPLVAGWRSKEIKLLVKDEDSTRSVKCGIHTEHFREIEPKGNGLTTTFIPMALEFKCLLNKPKFLKLSKIIYKNEHEVSLKVGRTLISYGKIKFKQESNNSLSLTIFVTISLIISVVGLVVCYYRTDRNNLRNNYRNEITRIEDQTRNDFRKLFAVLANDMENLEHGLQDKEISEPYHDFGEYMEMVLFPKEGKIILPSRCQSPFSSDIQQQLIDLLVNQQFFQALMEALEASHFSPLQEVEISSLFTVLLCTRPTKFVTLSQKIFTSLLKKQVTQNSSKFLRRLEKIQDRIAMNFIQWAMWNHVTQKSDFGKKFYILLHAVRNFQISAPVDECLNLAMQTLHPSHLLLKDVSFHRITVFVIVNKESLIPIDSTQVSFQQENLFYVSLLDVDTLLQAKEKIIFTISGHIRYSNWIHPDDIELFHVRSDSRAKNFVNKGMKLKNMKDPDGRIWTLRDYKIEESSEIRVQRRQSATTDTSSIDKMLDVGNLSRSRANSAEYETSILTDPKKRSSTKLNAKSFLSKFNTSKADEFDEQEMDSFLESENQPYHLLQRKELETKIFSETGVDKFLRSIKLKSKKEDDIGESGPVEELHYMRLITNRKSLQSYIEPILKEILSMKNQKIPEVLKFLFDLVDINNLQHRRAVKEGDYSNLQWKVCKNKIN